MGNLTESKPAAKKPAASRASEAYHKNNASDDEKPPRWDLVESYLPLVKSIVSRMRIYFPSHVDVEDIYSVGVAGLITASRNFDPEKGYAFGNYASLRVRGALLDELRRLDWMPRIDRINAQKYKKGVDELEQRLNRPATDEEICKDLDLTPEQQQRLRDQRRAIYMVPLDSSTDPDSPDAPSLHDAIADSTQVDGRDRAENNELLELLRERLEELPEVPRKVLTMYYLENMRLAEIAAVFNLTESRICQIHSQAIANLRTYLSRAMNK